MRLGLLFGSSARGTADEQSDVDVAIDVRGAADRLNISAQLSAALGQEVDLVVLGDVGVPLLDELVRDGIVAYEASPYAGARWRTRALIELETDRPWYGRMRDAWLARVAARGSTMVNRNIVAAKLTDLAARVARVRAHRKASSAELTADADAFDLVAFNLMLSVQICADIASHIIADEGWPSARTLAEAFDQLHKHAVLAQPTSEALARAAGLRNVVAHGYAGSDVGLVHAAATQGVADLEAFAREVARYIAAH